MPRYRLFETAATPASAIRGTGKPGDEIHVHGTRTVKVLELALFDEDESTFDGMLTIRSHLP